MSSMDAAARLAVAQAVYKAVAGAVSTKGDRNLRAEVDGETLALREMYGVKSRDIKIGNVKVGTMTVLTESRPQVVDAEAWERWKVDTGRADERRTIDLDALTFHERGLLLSMAEGVSPRAVRTEVVDCVPDWSRGLVSDGRGGALDEDGCPVPGVRWVDRVKGTALRGCEPGRVAEALHALPEPPDVGALLLGGGME